MHFRIVSAFFSVFIFFQTANAQLTVFQGSNGRYGFKNAKGEQVVEPKYLAVSDFVDGRALVNLDRKLGYVDAQGKLLVLYDVSEPIYLDSVTRSNQFAIVGFNQDGKKRLGVVNFETGKEMLSPAYEEIDAYNDRFLWLQSRDNFGYKIFGLWSMISGQVVFKPSYHAINDLDKHLLVAANRVGQEVRMGLLSANSGALVAPLQYDSIEVLSKGYYISYLKGKKGLYDSTGKEILPVRYEEISHPWQLRGRRDRVFDLKLGGKYGLAGANGEILLNSKYDQPIPRFIYPGDFGTVYINNKAALINSEFKEIYPAQFDKGSIKVSKGVAILPKNGNFALGDTTGRLLTDFVYQRAEPFSSNGRAKVKRNGKWGFVDLAGKEIVPCQYDEAESFSEGLALVKKDGQFGFIDANGDIKLPMKYYAASSFSDGLAAVSLEKNGGKYGRKHGYIDKTGKMILSAKYYIANPFYNGRARVSTKKYSLEEMLENFNKIEFFYIDKNGNEIKK